MNLACAGVCRVFMADAVRVLCVERELSVYECVCVLPQGAYSVHNEQFHVFSMRHERVLCVSGRECARIFVLCVKMRAL